MLTIPPRRLRVRLVLTIIVLAGLAAPAGAVTWFDFETEFIDDIPGSPLGATLHRTWDINLDLAGDPDGTNWGPKYTYWGPDAIRIDRFVIAVDSSSVTLVSPSGPGSISIDSGTVTFDQPGVTLLDHETSPNFWVGMQTPSNQFGVPVTVSADLTIVPEPAMLSLVAIGGLALVKRRRA